MIKKKFTSNRIPYIALPKFVRLNINIHNTMRNCYEKLGPIDDITCETGILNIDNGEKEKSPLKLNNVCIEDIEIACQATKKYYRYGLSYNEYVELEFQYVFHLKILCQNEDYYSFIMKADCMKHVDMPFYDMTYDISPILVLAKNIVPLINRHISFGNPIRSLNFSYLEKLLPQRDRKSNVHSFTFEDALDIIYNIQIIRGNDYITIIVGKGMKPYMNSYIVNLINSILNVDLKLNNVSNIYKSDLPKLFDYPKGIISAEKYIKCLLYLGLYDNFDESKSRKEYLIVPSSQSLEYIALKRNYLNDPPSKNFIQFFDFIADLNATNHINGQYRAGRDDCEWKEKTFTIPYKGFKISNKILSKINEILETNLNYQEEEKNNYSWNSNKNHPARYYSFEIYEHEYVPGLACSREDIGSHELTKESFYKLLDYFIKNDSIIDSNSITESYGIDTV